MVRAFEPENITSSFQKIEASFKKHVAREPNFEPSLGSTQPYQLHIPINLNLTLDSWTYQIVKQHSHNLFRNQKTAPCTIFVLFYRKKQIGSSQGYQKYDY